MERFLSRSPLAAVLALVMLLIPFAVAPADAQIFDPAPDNSAHNWINDERTIEILAEGKGWVRLRRWSSTPDDPSDPGGGAEELGKSLQGPTYEDKLIVQYEGIPHAPMPEWARSAAMDEAFPATEPGGGEGPADSARPDPVFDFFEVDEATMWSITESQARSIARATKEWTKTWTFNEGGNYDLWNYNNSAFQGSLSANVPINGTVTVYIKYKTFLGIFKGYREARITGNATIDGSVDLTGSLSYSQNFSVSHKVLQVPLYNATFASVDLKVYIGANATATISGELGVTTDIDINGNFFYECIKDQGCNGSSNFNDNFNTQYSLGVELEARAEGWARADIEAELAWGAVEAGVKAKGFIAADLWGYIGNTCGDGDGDGTNEFVSGLAAGASAGYDVDGYFDTIFTSHRDYNLLDDEFGLGWWDLLSGGSSALEPMVTGPDSVTVGSNASYVVKMRPCYPYEEDVTFTVTPNMSGGRVITGVPTGSTTLNHTFNSTGNQNVVVTATHDSFGRGLDATTTKTVNVQAAPQPPSITSHPSNQTVEEGNSAQFSVGVDGTGPFTYQWKRNGSNLSNGGHYSGVDTATLTVSNATTALQGSFSVQVTNAGGQVTSNSALLTVTTVPTGPCELQSFHVTNYTSGLPRVSWSTDCDNLSNVSVRVLTSTVGNVQSGCELDDALWDGSSDGNRTVDYMSGGYFSGCPAVTDADFWVQLWNTSTNSEIAHSTTKRATYNPPVLACDIQQFDVTNRAQGELPIISWDTDCEGTGISVQVKTSTLGNVPSGCELDRALWDGNKSGSREATYMAGGYFNNCPAVSDATFWVELWDGQNLIRRTDYKNAHYEE